MDFICRQTYIFLMANFAGVLAGFIFDIFRVKRKLVKTSDIVVYIEDILYWLIISIVLFVLMYYSKESELRGYILLGLFIGIIMYMCILSKYVLMFLRGTVNVVYKIVLIPILILIRLIRIPFKCFSFVKRKLKL